MVLFRRLTQLWVAFSVSCTTTNAWVTPSSSGVSTKCRTGTPSSDCGVSLSSLQQQQRVKFQNSQSIWTTLGASNIADASIETSQNIQDAAATTTTPAIINKDGASDVVSEFTVQQQAINALFLTATFGYALYTIFNIDQGMTRGWTTGEIAMRIPLDNWGAYESYLANKPIMTKTLINVIIYLLGDWLSQTAFQGKNILHFDIARTLRNGFIGLCFGPLVHQYYQFSDTILPPEDGLVTRLEKILMDQTIYLTVKCSIYISAVGLLKGDDWESVQETVKEKIVGVVFTAWKFWPLVHCITYGLIPARHRVLWVNSVDLVWNAILATMSQKSQPVGDQEAVATAELMEAKLLETDSVATTVSSTQENFTQEGQTHLLVLDNQWVQDKAAEVADIIMPNNPPSTNTTTDALPFAA